MPGSINLNMLPEAELETSNCAALVSTAYTIALTTRRNEQKALDAAIRAWRERNPTTPHVDAARAVEIILGKRIGPHRHRSATTHPSG